MVLRAFGPVEGRPLERSEVPTPEPGPGEILVRVSHCGVCHTDLHTVEGELPGVSLPRIPGHEVVGTVAMAGISMTPIPELAYSRDLYHEKTLRSVANATRRDGEELMQLAAEIPIRTTLRLFPLAEANEVLITLKEGRINGAAVLEV